MKKTREVQRFIFKSFFSLKGKSSAVMIKEIDGCECWIDKADFRVQFTGV